MFPRLHAETAADTTPNRPELEPIPRIRVLVGRQPEHVASSVPCAAETLQNGISDREDTSSTDTDSDGVLIQRAMKARDELLKREAQSKQLPVKRRRLQAPRSQGVSLKTLLDEHLIAAGKNALSLEYRGKIETADIDPDGKIDWKGTKFESPSAFSIHVKRLVNPSRKADDGWKTVKHNGRFLEYYKLELAKRRQIDSPVETVRPAEAATPIDASSLPPSRHPVCGWIEQTL